MFSLAGLTLIAAVIVFVQHLSLRPRTTTASIPSAESTALPLPDKPSIAVLPFTNMSGDRDQEYFSDGILDDIITDLFVIARTSTFSYKGKAAKVQDIGRELGVKYVLEGSIRKADSQCASPRSWWMRPRAITSGLNITTDRCGTSFRSRMKSSEGSMAVTAGFSERDIDSVKS